MGQGLHTKMIQVSPWGNRDGAGFTHRGDRDGARSIHKDDTG